ncbi:hypothetical protein ES703_125842 [subsurface metagenome]
MKKKKILVLFTAVLVLIFSFSSLVYAAEKDVRIGYITRLSVPWWIVCEDGFRDAATDFGFTPVLYHPPQLTVEDHLDL